MAVSYTHLDVYKRQKDGMVKKTAITEYQNIRKSGLQAINLKDGDELIEVKSTNNKKDILLVTKFGQCIRFHETDVRPTGRASMGVIGMKLDSGDEVLIGEKFQSNPEIAGSPRNSFRASLLKE